MRHKISVCAMERLSYRHNLDILVSCCNQQLWSNVIQKCHKMKPSPWPLWGRFDQSFILMRLQNT